MPARSVFSTCALGAAALAGCGAPSPQGPRPTAAADPCLMADATAPQRDTLRVALFSSVEPSHAPVPTTDAERLVFRQLYETLVRVDCMGTVRPGLAATWRAERGGSRWVFDLPPTARFWDGTPVDAAAVLAGWTSTPALAVQDVRPEGDGTIVVSLAASRSIESFGDAAWSVVKRIPETPWPLGTGPLWTRAWEDGAAGRVLRAAPTPFAPPGTPVLEFHVAEPTDPRDVLDQAIDAVVTRDAGAVRYGAGRGDWRDLPLPWDRTYVLASLLRLRTGTTAQLDSASRAAWARDAVRDDARAPASGAWWVGSDCPLDAPGVTSGRQEPLARHPWIIVPDDDRVATDLGARLVARADAELAALLGVRLDTLRAEPVPQARFRSQLAAGLAPAFVFSLPAHPLDACRAVAHLRARAPWLNPPHGRSADVLVPLVETRAHLLLRGVPGVEVDRDGGVRLVSGRRP